MQIFDGDLNSAPSEQDKQMLNPEPRSTFASFNRAIYACSQDGEIKYYYNDLDCMSIHFTLREYDIDPGIDPFFYLPEGTVNVFEV